MPDDKVLPRSARQRDALRRSAKLAQGSGGQGPTVMASGTSARGHLARNVYGLWAFARGGETG
jgi:hypothetical protein